MTTLHCSAWSAFLAATMLLFDNALVTQSRFILLDSMLVFFILLSLYLYLLARQRPALSVLWIILITLTGISLGCAMSIKFVGLFAMALVGLLVLRDLWYALGDTSNSLRHLGHRVLWLFVGLILVPAAVYIQFFSIHFSLLHKSGPGDAFMSTMFQVSCGCT